MHLLNKYQIVLGFLAVLSDFTMTDNYSNQFAVKFLIKKNQPAFFERRNINVKNPYITDGAWGEWSSWSTQSITCSDTQVYDTRRRNCDSPAPLNNGKICSGSDTETRIKDVPKCLGALCPPDFEFLKESNKCYKYDSTPSNWEGARARCNSFHPASHLIIIDDVVENMVAKNYSRSKDSFVYGVWISAQTFDPKNPYTAYYWKPFADQTTWRLMKFSDFGPGQPSRQSGTEACLHFYGSFADFEWNDTYCDSTIWPAVCEIDQ